MDYAKGSIALRNSLCHYPYCYQIINLIEFLVLLLHLLINRVEIFSSALYLCAYAPLIEALFYCVNELFCLFLPFLPFLGNLFPKELVCLGVNGLQCKVFK